VELVAYGCFLERRKRKFTLEREMNESKKFIFAYNRDRKVYTPKDNLEKKKYHLLSHIYIFLNLCEIIKMVTRCRMKFCSE
jgi:hypothetical protein